jgi:SAM-dependent methyltransferase
MGSTSTQPATLARTQREPGSFRDRGNRVFYHAGAVFRGLNERGLKEWETLSSTSFFQHFMGSGKLVHTEQVAATETPELFQAEQWSAVLTHQRIPFISYPYEWSFGMLQDAALLQLELQLAALDEDMTLKDASPFNIQWVGTSPVFIDIPSLERLAPGEPWVGYEQFCQLFLYPLFLQAYKDIPFQPWVRGCIDGITSQDCYHLMSLRDLIRPGVFLNVALQAWARARYARTAQDIKKDLREAGFHKALIKTNVTRLRKTIHQLSWKRTHSPWSHYTSDNSYTDASREQKAAFVRQVVNSRSWNLVWDLGCNLGTFSRIAAAHARYVIAMDADHLTVERLYQTLKAEGNTTILPLVNNVADSSPNLGWRGLERKALAERGTPDLTLCLALLHHVVIGANIPLDEFIDWLAGLGTEVVIEFVTRQDPMVRALLQHKNDHYPDYEVEYFERSLAEAFTVVRREVLSGETRILYHGKAKTR